MIIFAKNLAHVGFFLYLCGKIDANIRKLIILALINYVITSLRRITAVLC